MSIKTAIDFLKEKGKFDSYAAMARAAGISRARMQNIRAGLATPNVREEYALADACGMQPVEVIALVETAKDPEQRSFWSKYTQVFRKLLRAKNLTLRMAP
ncbi:helix-turn-helix domain-containing protein [Ralstonia pseudosolanacearum]|uniref:helix-turn-helix domain-containing protein n=1 Tax=Ralstonia pseudosolanacearum TaxID=1310165 RepID=UPI0020054C56|nr:helix-turn-helix transcriptional regulator [Ralstonia pseudosolanacearum]MCK4152126.1 transcriptional regulator [Ralstonia pseudosolanacearum]